MRERLNTVLVDMDGVMADFDSAALVNVPEHLRVPRSQFYVAQDYPEQMRPSIESVYNAPGFFEALEPMPGMREAWQLMLDHGYSPRIASAPLSSNRTSIEGKIKWLERVMVSEFGPQIVEDAIIDRDKWKYSGLALIDDRPDVVKGVGGQKSADWEHVLFGWPHLAQVSLATTAFRLMSWRDTGVLIETLDLLAQSRAK